MKKLNISRIAISRTDAIGDAILTLPSVGYLKSEFPEMKVDFILRNYTYDIIAKSKFPNQVVLKENFEDYVKEFKPDAILFVFPDIDIAKISKKYKIKYRVGTSHRLKHWLYMNKLVNFTRKNSNLHESQLNFKLLKGIGISKEPELSEIPQWFGFEKKEKSTSDKIKLIFHPKSSGSARDWKLKNYKALGELLAEDKFEIHISGTQKEEQIILSEDPDFFKSRRFINQTGKFTLSEFFDFIQDSDGLVACSTGPLHIAAAMDKFALGLYPPIRPMHPGRWAPLGKNAYVITGKPDCMLCADIPNCECMRSIEVANVAKIINSHFKLEEAQK